MVNKELLKTAATTLRTINRERKEYKEKLASFNKAEDLVKRLLNTQELTAEEVLQKISEFKQKPLAELELAETALDLVKGGSINLGSIAEDHPTPNGEMDNLTRYLLYGDQE
jgi:hypothetical protein